MMNATHTYPVMNWTNASEGFGAVCLFAFAMVDTTAIAVTKRQAAIPGLTL